MQREAGIEILLGLHVHHVAISEPTKFYNKIYISEIVY